MIDERFGLKVTWKQKLPVVNHTFTRYKAHLYPYCFMAEFIRKIDKYDWIPTQNLSELPFSSGHRRILSL